MSVSEEQCASKSEKCLNLVALAILTKPNILSGKFPGKPSCLSCLVRGVLAHSPLIYGHNPATSLFFSFLLVGSALKYKPSLHTLAGGKLSKNRGQINSHEFHAFLLSRDVDSVIV